jgi:hypothetical protein
MVASLDVYMAATKEYYLGTKLAVSSDNMKAGWLVVYSVDVKDNVKDDLMVDR